MLSYQFLLAAFFCTQALASYAASGLKNNAVKLEAASGEACQMELAVDYTSATFALLSTLASRKYYNQVRLQA